MIHADWEAAWAPYDEDTYGAALACLQPEDAVLDIGAGDLRFARRAAARVRAVWAIERRAELLRDPVPPNVRIICGDALTVPLPRGVTVGVLLMRHCRHFAGYVARLRAIGCARLVTNARWGMDVECVSLAPQPPYALAGPGWYACLCGSVGFKPGPADSLLPDTLNRIQALEGCPACRPADPPGIDPERVWSASSSSRTAPN